MYVSICSKCLSPLQITYLSKYSKSKYKWEVYLERPLQNSKQNIKEQRIFLKGESILHIRGCVHGLLWHVPGC